MTGTHVGCEHGVCGACTIRLDGVPARACLLLAVQADGRRVDTVEGLAREDGALHPLQRAFRRHHALQCGFCTPGILMSLSDYLEKQAAPDEAAIRAMLSGHLCRCTGYTGIVRAALEAAQEMTRERSGA
jgi:2-furoyl-CoA dehydrogenase 2Fe-2S iron sulfur subunit